MLLFIYILLFSLIYFFNKARKKTKNLKDIIWVYNFCFLLSMFILFGLKLEDNPNFTNTIFLLLQAFYLTIRSMGFSKEFLYYEDIFHLFGPSGLVMLQVWLIVVFSSFYTAQFLLMTFLKDQINRLKMNISLHFQNKVYFLAGDEDNALELINSIRKRDKRSTLIWFVDDLDLDKLSSPDRVLLKPLGDIDKWFLPNIKKKKEYIGILIFDDEDKNINLLSIFDKIKDEKKENIKFTVLTDNEHLRFTDLKTHLDSYFVSKPNLLAKDILNINSSVSVTRDDVLARSSHFIDILKRNGKMAYDLDGFALLKKDIHIAIVGYGEIGMELMLMSYENSRFLNEKLEENKFNVHIFIENHEDSNDYFMENSSYFKSKVNYEEYRGCLRSKETLDILKENLHKYEMIFIASDDDEENIKIAISLIEHIKKENISSQPQIIVFANSRVANIENTSINIYTDYPYINIVNISNKVFSQETLIDRKHEKIARKYHERYKEIMKIEDGQAYKDLNNFTKESNLAAAYDEFNKKVLLDKVDSSKIDENLESLALKLAMYEHYRWCALHVTRDWKPLLLEELSRDERANMIKKRPQERKHLCLASWDDLNLLEGQLGSVSSSQEYNIKEAERFILDLRRL